MTASDHLSKNQFRLFHGTNKNLKDGFVNPTKQRGDEWDGQGPEAAFASSRPDEAAEYGAHVYEVKPTGYEDHHGYNVYSNEDGFEVKRKLKPEVVDRYRKIVTPIHEANELAKEKRERAGRISWSSVPSPSGSHIRYDEHGEEHSTVLRPGQQRPGDSAPIHDNYYHPNYEKKTVTHSKWNEKANNWTHVKDISPEQYLKVKKNPSDWHRHGLEQTVQEWTAKSK